MKSYLYFIFIFLGFLGPNQCYLVNVSIAQEYSPQCSAELERFFSSPEWTERSKDFIRIKGKLTMHRIAYLFFRNANMNEQLKVESVINAYLNDMKYLESTDADFAAAKAKFQINSYNREALAKIMPYIKNIINEQSKMTNPVDRERFLLDEGDLKILSFLGQREVAGGSNLINFAKIIDISLKNRQFGNATKTIIEKQIVSLNAMIDAFVKNMPISAECRLNLGITVCSDCEDVKVDKNKVEELILNKLEDSADTYLRHGQFWLHVSKSDYITQSPSSSGRSRIISSSPAAKKYSDNPISGEVPTWVRQTQSAYLDALADKVLTRYNYFGEKADLLANPELTIALAWGIDSGKSEFFYKGKRYALPSLNNAQVERIRGEQFSQKVIDQSNALIELGMSIAGAPATYLFTYYTPDFVKAGVSTVASYADKALSWAASYLPQPMVEYVAESNGNLQGYMAIVKANIPSCAQNDSGVWDEQDIRLVAYALIGATQKPDEKTFVFRGRQCDARTGGKLPHDQLSGLLSYPLGDATSPSVLDYSQYSELRWKAIHDALKANTEYYVYKGQVYNLSGIEVRAIDHGISTGDSELDQKLLVAEVEHVKFVVHLGKVYTGKGEKVSDADLKARIEKYIGGPISGIVGNTSSQKLIAWAVAIEEKQVIFQFDGNNYYTNSGYEMLDSLSFDRLPGTIDGKIFVESRDWYDTIGKMNQLDDSQLIQAYHKNVVGSICGYFTIVDKKNARIKVFTDEGTLIWEKEILLGRNASDQRIKLLDDDLESTNGFTSAGVFSFGSIKSPNDGPAYVHYEGNLMQLVSQSGSGPKSNTNVFALHQVPENLPQRYHYFDNSTLSDNRTSGGSINLKKTDFEEFESLFIKGKSCELYVLPEEAGNRFEIDGGKLVFAPVNPAQMCVKISTNGCNDEYRYSPSFSAEVGEVPKDIQIAVDRAIFDSIAPGYYSWLFGSQEAPLRLFVSGLEDGKDKIMKDTGLSNEEYDELSKMAVAIVGVESEFCASDKYALKEAPGGQTLISTLKFVQSLSISGITSNSRGCTQIKDVSSFSGDKFSGEDLANPYLSAQATMYVLATLLGELKARSRAGKIDAEVYFSSSSGHSINYNEFLYYLYNGSSSQLETGAATPYDSVRNMRILDYYSRVRVYTEK